MKPHRSTLPDPHSPGSRIGPYVIRKLLGEGGFGSVYLAEQDEPVRRRVALKVLKLGMDTRRVIARFEAERHALARMDHPYIARVFDAGATDQGRPYFVMEHVVGVPIRAYCDSFQLDTERRLGLFLKVTEAIHHAHQKGIIHRDIKPSNILVFARGEAAVPKVIDFGVAKATDHRLSETSFFTSAGQLIGTPAYMSPEQAEMSGDIDTQSDIYSLGVLLYELLAGSLPFPPEKFKDAGLAEVQRIIREEEPEKPSTRIVAEPSPGIAEQRRTRLRTLRRELRGDLDWITMKALEKDRSRRYATVSEFAADIERYLERQPVLAGPPGALYRLGKFVARHRALVAATLVASLTLLLGLAGIVWQATVAAAERDRALEAREQAEEMHEFFTGMLASADPAKARGKDVTVRELLDRAAAGMDASLTRRPELRAAILTTIGNTYVSLGRHAEAEPHLAEALEIRERVLGKQHRDTLRSMNFLGQALWKQGKLDQAEPLLRESLARSRSAFGEEDRETLSVANNLGILLRDRGKLDEAEDLLRRTLELRRKAEASDPERISSLLKNLGLLLLDLNKLDAAEPLLREALATDRRLRGEEHPHTLISMNQYAGLLKARGRLEEAEPLLRKVLEIRRRILGGEHEHTVASLNNLAMLLRARGKLEDAEALLREALAMNLRVRGREHTHTLFAMHNLALVLVSRGKALEAERLLREAVTTAERSLGPGHWCPATFRAGFGQCLAKLGRRQEAETELLAATRRLETALGPEHPRTLSAIEHLVELYETWGKPRLAEEFRNRLPKEQAGKQ
ncbi:MAG: tetratricopeptide repeat protein [Planctomycetota bacterium]